MISIVMATYNGEKYIEQQLATLKAQTITPDELIIIDDGSKDNTLAIVDKFKIENKEIKVKVFINEKNLGPARTFAKAILKSSGDFIYLCDQDDIWLENKIEEMQKVFYENPRVKVLCTSYYVYEELNDKIINMGNTGQLSKISLYQVLEGTIAPGCVTAFRGDLREAARRINEKIFIHDWFYNVIGALEEGLYFYDQPFIKYRIHGNNTIGIDNSFWDKFNKKKYLKRFEPTVEFYGELIDQKMVIDEKTIQYLNNKIEILDLRLGYIKGEISLVQYFSKLKKLKEGASNSLIIDTIRKINVIK